MTVKTKTKTGKKKNSVEKCEKKVSKPIKPLAFPERFICDALNVLSKPLGLELFFDNV